MIHRDQEPDGAFRAEMGPELESLDRALRDWADRSAASVQLPVTRQPFHRPRSWAPVAVAATVAGLLLAGRLAVQDGGDGLAAPDRPGVLSPADLDVESDGPFVVIATTDPDISVVWLLDSED